MDTQGRPAVYPWATWFGADDWVVLRRGEDYLVAPLVMAQQIRTRAVKERLRVSVLRCGDRLDLRVVGRPGAAGRQLSLWRK